MIVRAPAKLNLCLYLGPRRGDGLHELLSLVEPIEVFDELQVEESSDGRDEVRCPGIEGPELAGRALAALRDAGWEGPPLRIEVSKRIPVAAGLGGGSADAAAVLRLARLEVTGLEALAAELGADVPAQLDPSFCLVSGAGERVEPLPEPAGHGIVLVPREPGLSTAEVYAEADRLGLGRSERELAQLAERLHGAALAGSSPLAYRELLSNDLQEAAISLRPEIEATLVALEDAGAFRTLVAGSGPTACGLFTDRASAAVAAEGLRDQHPGAIATGPGSAV